MKISRNWLQTFFDNPLPSAATMSDALTFHAFEVDGIEKRGEDDVLDVKVTANRGHDCLCHLGIAKEISAILNIPCKKYGDAISIFPATDAISVSIDTPLCRRYVGGYIRNVKIGSSPQWLVDRLAAMGQRSINNVVDAGNFVMFNIGQPLHAFDATKVKNKKIIVRHARAGENMTALDGKEYTLDPSMLVIADSDSAIGVAGVKGGIASGIDETTTDLIIESANFDGVSVRKTAQALTLRTDASARFEQQISPWLAGYGMRAFVELILQLAGGEVVGFVDVYPNEQQSAQVTVSLEQINTTLGTAITAVEVMDAFTRLGFSVEQKDDVFFVTPPFERLDLVIPEDLIEEVGRIIGYDKVPAVELPAFTGSVEINKNFYTAERVREDLMSQGYSEVFTSVFAEKGERLVANKVDGVRPYLRSNLIDGLSEALKKNIPHEDLLMLKEIKLFEIGTVWREGKEVVMVGSISEGKKTTEKPLEEYMQDNPRGDASWMGYEDLPLSMASRYALFSKYPYIVRDIAVWVSSGTEQGKVLEIIKQNAGELLVHGSLFDQFHKGDKTSLAFRLIFQSFEKTLTDKEVNAIMERISAALAAKGFEIR